MAVTPENNNSEQPSPQSGIFWRRGEAVFYVIAALAESSALAVVVLMELGLLASLAVVLVAWWAVLISFWSHPAFCWLEIERGWLREARAGRGSLLFRVAVSVVYWPLLVPKLVYLWLLICGAGLFYLLKYRHVFA